MFQPYQSFSHPLYSAGAPCGDGDGTLPFEATQAFQEMHAEAYASPSAACAGLGMQDATPRYSPEMLRSKQLPPGPIEAKGKNQVEHNEEEVKNVAEPTPPPETKQPEVPGPAPNTQKPIVQPKSTMVAATTMLGDEARFNRVKK